jgi:hypothetical protein
MEFGEPVALKSQKTSIQKDLYFQIRKKENLYSAWKKVYENGSKSQSIDTQKAVKKFNIDYVKHIGNIQRKLRNNQYHFTPSKGVPKLRPGKSPRPIVVSSIKDRIVQRSILDVIQSIESIKKYFDVPTSFGGIKGRKVRDAINQVCKAIKSGSKFYISSDIKNFFIRIPRLTVVKTITDLLPDGSLDKILDQASITELENLADLGRKSELFPTYELGVAQGCCLSPLFGNILLHNFDYELNSISEGTICLRYIDDFIILGQTLADVRKAFKRGREILKDFRMDTYDPSDGSGKADEGCITNKRIEYLGCLIDENFVHPSKKSVRSIKKKINDQLKTNSKQLKNANSERWNKKYSLLETLQQISNILMGWGNQYSFCNATAFMRDIDREVDKYISEYLTEYKICRNKLYEEKALDGLRRILGVHLLAESNPNPILPLKCTKINSY